MECSEQVVVGNTTPKLRERCFGINAGYKGFTFSIACNYTLGGSIFKSSSNGECDRLENLDRCQEGL